MNTGSGVNLVLVPTGGSFLGPERLKSTPLEVPVHLDTKLVGERGDHKQSLDGWGSKACFPTAMLRNVKRCEQLHNLVVQRW